MTAPLKTLAESLLDVARRIDVAAARGSISNAGAARSETAKQVALRDDYNDRAPTRGPVKRPA
jgi:hypothetical protein